MFGEWSILQPLNSKCSDLSFSHTYQVQNHRELPTDNYVKMSMNGAYLHNVNIVGAWGSTCKKIIWWVDFCFFCQFIPDIQYFKIRLVIKLVKTPSIVVELGLNRDRI